MTSLNIFLGIVSGSQIIIIVVVILLLFGGRKIPELMRGLGSGIKEFKNASKEDSEEKKKKKPRLIIEVFYCFLKFNCCTRSSNHQHSTVSAYCLIIKINANNCIRPQTNRSFFHLF